MPALRKAPLQVPVAEPLLAARFSQLSEPSHLESVRRHLRFGCLFRFARQGRPTGSPLREPGIAVGVAQAYSCLCGLPLARPTKTAQAGVPVLQNPIPPRRRRGRREKPAEDKGIQAFLHITTFSTTRCSVLRVTNFVRGAIRFRVRGGARRCRRRVFRFRPGSAVRRGGGGASGCR